MDRPTFLMTDPACFDVSYRINPWMDPKGWTPAHAQAAGDGSAALRAGLLAAGAHVETIAAVKGLPDLVFPANAAVVLDGKVLLARFRHPERQGEEPVFRSVFQRLKTRGLVHQIVDLPAGLFHEGAGDAIWDAERRVFWCGYGPRSSQGAIGVIRKTFGQQTVALELATDQFYHLDTCFCPLTGGKVLYYPAAFTPDALATIRARVPESQRIEATAEEAAAFCVNAVNLDAKVIMARAPDSLRTKLRARGYRLVEVDLDPFILSGGASYCMTLRLDRTLVPAAQLHAAE
ncbi:MAG: amidinotransferase [Alphaproteobacteria bacterium]|nr:amidinotransferase [Alphaproteobacteria bacterium]MBU1516246.1 amidinotransferase [Alphaproteobacteria bacterium]MBU2095783.1 amidinotransferase [Alphaproteobacteria bacterium]MBU2151899.1 amidinotransferase [Alphaproteobacteria bacterium]MBU2306818.1 amidinotransferase [Alphaproteobacteria bacterium]